MQRECRLILWIGVVVILRTIWHVSWWTVVRHLKFRHLGLSDDRLCSWHSKLLGVTEMD